jgi:hypothetical protein
MRTPAVNRDYNNSNKKKAVVEVPASLSAPRYNYLLREAVKITQTPDVGASGGKGKSPAGVFTPSSMSSSPGMISGMLETPGLSTLMRGVGLQSPMVGSPGHISDAQSVISSSSSSESANSSKTSEYSYLSHQGPSPPRSTLVQRVKSFFTYLSPSKPKSSKKQQHVAPKPALPGLPLPDTSMELKPVSAYQFDREMTTAPPHPKELVDLNHVPSPMRPLPQVKKEPRRLVDLRTVPEDEQDWRHRGRSASVASLDARKPLVRTGSASSVRELVQSFDELQRKHEEEANMSGFSLTGRGPSLSRRGSMSSLRSVGSFSDLRSLNASPNTSLNAGSVSMRERSLWRM